MYSMSGDRAPLHRPPLSRHRSEKSPAIITFWLIGEFFLSFGLAHVLAQTSDLYCLYDLASIVHVYVHDGLLSALDSSALFL